MEISAVSYSLLECFVVFWWPVVVFGLGAVFAFLVGEVRPDGVDLHKRPEHGVRLPVNVVHTHHCEKKKTFSQLILQ